jgi:hypothetical protein
VLRSSCRTWIRRATKGRSPLVGDGCAPDPDAVAGLSRTVRALATGSHQAIERDRIRCAPCREGSGMPTKWGQIESWGRTDSKFVEAYLDTGAKVELPHAVRDHLNATYESTSVLVFVERRGRLFRYVQWVGTPAEAVSAIRDGTLHAQEVPPAVHALATMPSAEVPSPVPAIASAESTEPDRLLFGLNGGEVAVLLSGLMNSGPEAWGALLAAHSEAYRSDHEARARRVSLLVSGAEKRGIATGAISAEDGPSATRLAEEAAAKMVPLILAGRQGRSAGEPEVLSRAVAEFARSAANTLAAVLVVRPFLEPEEFDELWAPYAPVLGYPGRPNR